jgi:hypothetical protein
VSLSMMTIERMCATGSMFGIRTAWGYATTSFSSYDTPYLLRRSELEIHNLNCTILYGSELEPIYGLYTILC